MATSLSLFTFLSWLLLFIPPSISQSSSQAITLNSSLSTLQENPSWASPSGEFAFGFYHLPDEDAFLLAIWFDKIPEKTVVWCSNRDKLVQKGSKVELTAQGQLILYDHQGQKVWSSKATNAASAAMLDNGNFVLLSTNQSHIWGSFNEPTDTMLPMQKLDSSSSISSRRTESESDYSTGRFQLRFDEQSGQLQLITINLPTQFEYKAEGSIGSLGNGTQLVFNETGGIYLVGNTSNTSMSNLTPAKLVSIDDFYQRATLDFDGVFRQYTYPKRHGGNWSVVGAIPKDICTEIVGYPGSGPCGFNSYCKLDQNQRPRCECPPGYSPIRPNNTWEGCKQDFPSQSCSLEGLGEEIQTSYKMEEMANTTWLLSDFEVFSPIDEGLCKQSCLEDCFCAVAIFSNGSCSLKRLPLSNGRTDPNITGKAFIKLPTNDSSHSPLPPNSCRGKNDKAELILTGLALLGGSVFFNLFLLSAIGFVVFNSYHKKLLSTHPNSSLTGLNLRSFTFKEIEEATNGFKEELGRGAFGIVYKGSLQSNSLSTTLVAVKRFDKVLHEGETEFRTEVSVIGQTHHRNLVRLLGFCDEGPHRLIVYEFMSNGSLATFLFGNSRPDWNRRLQIAVGIARGLMYLHEECSTQIIHCDIKPHNILLDDWLVARISDFGLAKLLKTDQTRTNTGIRGTPGYLAPEWFRNLSITVKVDVYSFGMVLLEIICCRKHVEMELGHEDETILKDWAYKCYREGRLDLLVGNDEEAMNDKKTMERMVMVAIWCVQEDPSLRPSMKRVVRMMTGVVEVSVPLNPSCTSFG